MSGFIRIELAFPGVTIAKVPRNSNPILTEFEAGHLYIAFSDQDLETLGLVTKEYLVVEYDASVPADLVGYPFKKYLFSLQTGTNDAGEACMAFFRNASDVDAGVGRMSMDVYVSDEIQEEQHA